MNAPRESVPEASAALASAFEAQRAAFAQDPFPDARTRRERLSRVLAILEDEKSWVDAIDRDFGHRSAHETRLAELYVVGAEARHARRHVARWMRPVRVS